MKKTLHCPICCVPGRIASVSVPEDDMFQVYVECMTCPDHLGTVVTLPTVVVDQYDIPEFGSNIYLPLATELNKRARDQDDDDDDNKEPV